MVGTSDGHDNSADPVARIAALTEQINYHNQRYYEQDSPEIPDAEWDALTVELKKLEASHPELAQADSPTQRVGGAPSATICPRHAPGSHDEPGQRLLN